MLLKTSKLKRWNQRSENHPSSAMLESHRQPACSRYLEAFTLVLELGDDRLVAWLCSQLQPHAILGAHPPLLSQHILLALLQQLGHDLKEVSPCQDARKMLGLFPIISGCSRVCLGNRECLQMAAQTYLKRFCRRNIHELLVRHETALLRV